MRLSKFLAYCGVCSRRKAKDLILEGKVFINGKVIKDLSYQVDLLKDKVYLENQLIKLPPKVYYLFYKPKGFLTSLFDPYERKTIKSFLEKLPYKVFPVGRLDKYSEGLLLLTNDGDLANKLLHPRYEVVRVYQVWVSPKLDPEKINKLQNQGFWIEGRLVKPLRVEFIKVEQKKWVYEIEVKEGIKREVRKIVSYLGGKVHKLLRIQFGPLKLKDLKPGEIKPLNSYELKKLFLFIKNLKQVLKV